MQADIATSDPANVGRSNMRSIRFMTFAPIGIWTRYSEYEILPNQRSTRDSMWANAMSTAVVAPTKATGPSIRTAVAAAQTRIADRYCSRVRASRLYSNVRI